MEGLIGVKRRFVRFNGAMSTQQIDWLKEELSSAKQQKQNVIVIGKCLKFQE
jgi:manganese-dependent ADP-ribose/CDP-alcohol diphosphatase